MKTTLRILRPRPIAACVYILLGMAAYGFYFWSPSQGLKDLLGDTGFVVWNWFLLGGAIISTLGCLTRRYYVELVGLPFMWAGIGVYGIYLIPRIPDAPNPGVLFALAAVFLSTSTEIAGRTVEVWRVLKIAEDFEKRISDGNG